MLGTNGGGFFNANSAHPFENPTPLTNLFEMFLIFPIPAAPDLHVRANGGRHTPGLGYLRRHAPMFLAGVFVCYRFEQSGNPISPSSALRLQPLPARNPAETWKARRSRFGIANSALFATVTTDASCGAVNSMHDSFTPIGGLVPLFNIDDRRGDLRRRGRRPVRDAYSYAILAVFIAGLMVGRTPEYLGKKIEQKEVKMAMMAIIATSACILVFTGAQFGRSISPRRLLESARPGHRQHEQQRPSRIQRDPVRLRQRHRAITAAPLPASTPIRRGTT